MKFGTTDAMLRLYALTREYGNQPEEKCHQVFGHDDILAYIGTSHDKATGLLAGYQIFLQFVQQLAEKLLAKPQISKAALKEQLISLAPNQIAEHYDFARLAIDKCFEHFEQAKGFSETENRADKIQILRLAFGYVLSRYLDENQKLEELSKEAIAQQVSTITARWQDKSELYSLAALFFDDKITIQPANAEVFETILIDLENADSNVFVEEYARLAGLAITKNHCLDFVDSRKREFGACWG